MAALSKTLVRRASIEFAVGEQGEWTSGLLSHVSCSGIGTLATHSAERPAGLGSGSQGGQGAEQWGWLLIFFGWVS